MGKWQVRHNFPVKENSRRLQGLFPSPVFPQIIIKLRKTKHFGKRGQDKMVRYTVHTAHPIKLLMVWHSAHDVNRSLAPNRNTPFVLEQTAPEIQ